MKTTKAFVTGAMLGAGALYFLDPRMGNRRRSLIADQIRRMSRKASCAVDAGVRDLGNRTRGIMHEAGSFVGNGEWPQPQRHTTMAEQCPLAMSPGARLLSAGCGTALMANCMIRRSPSAVLWGTLGFVMFAKAVDAGPRGVHVEKTFDIEAPPEKVFDFFTHPNNWMRVSDVVTNVEVFDDGRFAKTLLIAGVPLRFEERFVRCKENCLIETQSEPSSVMKFDKHLTLEEVGNGCTRLRMSFHYHPPGGTLGHAIASVFGIDAKSVLTDLLVRMKYYLETGREPHDSVCSRRRHAGHRSSTGSGSHRDAESGAMLGAGAPAEDARRFDMRSFEQPTPWPKSEEVVASELPGEHFPTAMD
ncbi:MAG TPA: SRPBCC family protein [Pirellulaceae bacterium]